MSEDTRSAGQVDAVAVVGACVPERQEYARRLARSRGSVMVPAHRVSQNPAVVDQTRDLLRRVPDHVGILVEYPMEIPAMDVIAELAGPGAETRLQDLICVVDVAHLLADLEGQVYVRLPFPAAEGEEDVAHFASRAELIVTQIEFSSAVLLVNWQQLPRQRLSLVMALISHLSPQARLDLVDLDHGLEEAGQEIAGTEPYSAEQTRAGWVSLLNRDFAPEFHSPAVGALRYEQLRLFHPGRLHDLLTEQLESGDFGLVLRSAGFCRLATRAHVTARWEQVGTQFSLTPLAFDHQLGEADELLAIGQELAFIGLGLDVEALRQALDSAALTDAELSAGPGLWATFPDVFPEWRAIDG